jgi:hypothetical protein
MNNPNKVNCKSFRPAIAYIKQELGTNLTGAEIGVYKGDNAEFILSILQPKMLYLVDPWNNFLDQDSNEIIGEVQYLETQQRLNKYGNKILIKKTSLEASKMFKDEEFDFVYIDADHSHDGISQDLRLWYPKVRKGGILSGHDYHQNMIGVVMAVNEFCDEYKLKIMHSITDWWVKK